MVNSYRKGEKMSRFIRTITLDIEDLYGIVNSLRDNCGCPDCQRIANDLLDQNRKQVTA